jgi:hypothetical protein
MAKRIRQLLGRHNKFGDDLYALMPKQYRPDPAKGETWDPREDIETGDLTRGMWRWAICEVARCHDCLIDVTAYLMMKADDAKRNATPIDAVDGPTDSDDLDDLPGDQNATDATKDATDSHGEPAEPLATDTAESAGS